MALSPQVAASSAAVVEQHKLTFPVLSDAGNGYARQLGIAHELPADLREVYQGFGIDLPRVNGDDSWMLPIPARIVADARGMIASFEADPDYTTRPDPGETLDVLRQLG